MEYRVDGRAYCLAAGDMAVLTRWEGETCFPTGHYHGVTVTLDPTRAPDCLSCFLEDVDVRPQALMDRYCREGGCFVARSSPRVEHIFSELYTVPEGIRRGYLSVKLLELLLALSVWEGEPRPGGTPAQTRLVGEAEALLQERPEEHWTLARLSQRLGASPSLLQGSFRAVYGMSPGAFLRARRMRYAAELLRRSDESVLAIAGQLGIQTVRAGCLPEDKLRYIDDCQQAGEPVCMIGDGINDAPALKKAHVGIAMGGVGSDIAVDATDIALVDDEVKELPHLIALSHRMMTTIKLNMSFSMALNFVAIILAIIGTLNPVVGALVHNAGSVLVIVNSSLLLKWRKRP